MRPPLADLVRDQVRKGRTVRLLVGGWSMVPLIWPGSRLTVAPWPEGGPRVGDIAAVSSGGHLVFHLVHHVEGPDSIVRTRGLASLHADPPAREPEWIGRVVRVEWGRISIPTDHPAFRLTRAVCERMGPILGLARALSLRAAAMVRGPSIRRDRGADRREGSRPRPRGRRSSNRNRFGSNRETL